MVGGAKHRRVAGQIDWDKYILLPPTRYWGGKQRVKIVATIDGDSAPMHAWVK